MSMLINKLSKKPKVMVCNDSFTVLVTFQEIADIQVNKEKYKLLDPKFQVARDKDKIKEMVKEYRTNPEFLLSNSVITIAIISIGDTTETYLMDGQHRLEMVSTIYKNYKENNSMLFSIQHVNSEDKMRGLFNTLNKDSTKNKQYVSLGIFNKIKTENIKELLEKKFKGAYAKTKSAKSSLYTISEFVDKLIEHGYIEDYDNENINNRTDNDSYNDSDSDSSSDCSSDNIHNVNVNANANTNKDKSAEEIVEEIENVHRIFFNTLKYLENSQNDKLYTQTEIKAIRDHKNVMFFKNNNFINHLTHKQIPLHDDLITRKKITNKLRKQVWQKKFGAKESGICPVKYCDHKISNEKFGFQCGHVVSFANGGKETEENLRPICADCNSKMSATNWEDYEEKLERYKFWYDANGDDNDGTCEVCENKIITKDDFVLVKIQNKKGKNVTKIACKKCYKSKS